MHSLKDLPSQLEEGLTLAAVLEREHPGDVLISRAGSKYRELPEGSVLGTSSLRRTAQIKAIRPDLQVVDIRGNVETRIKKMEEQQLDGIILAYAGVKRLGLEQWITDPLTFEVMLPATGQGIIAIETRDPDAQISGLLEAINHKETYIEMQAERAFLNRLEGGCQVPIGSLAKSSGNSLDLQGLVASLDGTKIIRDSVTASDPDPVQLGLELAERMLAAGAEDILNSIRNMGD